MPIPASERGFTLLELMTVVLLIGLLLGVGLSLDFADSANTPQQQAQRLAQQFTLASEEAVLSGAIVGLDFYRTADNANGYRWLSHDGKQWHELTPALVDAESSQHTLPLQQLQLLIDGTPLEFEELQVLEGDQDAERQRFTPEILLLPTRELTPFSLILGEAVGGVVLSMDALGRTTVTDNAR
ncbi:MAG: type II secretion system minor pseudopilin GspH [Pseudomonadota bacterium]